MTEAPTLDTLKNQAVLSKLEGVGSRPLVIIRTVFPFRFFPCTIKLDREKITISNSLFFFAKEVENFLVKDLVSITTSENILFASITLISGLRLNRKLRIDYFWKADAHQFRRTCQGLIIALKENVDVMKVGDQELVSKLEEIGKANI